MQERSEIDWERLEEEYQSGTLSIRAIVGQLGISEVYIWKELNEEMTRRVNVLRWMRERNIRSYREVAGVITEYNAKPEEFYEKEVLAGAPAKNS